LDDLLLMSERGLDLFWVGRTVFCEQVAVWRSEIVDMTFAGDLSESDVLRLQRAEGRDHGGGVLVLVTGSLSTKSNEKRNFVQSFFLAPQEKGYFVLNDIFRYLDVETHQTVVPRAESNQSAYNPEPAVVHQPVPEPGE
jgi:hypothetical protein